MKSIPVDTSGLQFAVVEVVPAADQAGIQKLDAERRPLWLVRVLTQSADAKPEVIEVRIASNAEPRLTPLAPVAFVGLKATPWNMEGRNGLSFSAQAVNAAPVKNGQHTPKPAEPEKANA